MPRHNETRNARFQAFRASRPTVSIAEIASYLGRNTKTVHMWNVGYPGSIPLDTIRLLELAFPATVKTDDDDDLIG